MAPRLDAVEDSVGGAKERRRLRRERLDQKRRRLEQEQLQRFSIRNFRLVSGLPEASSVYRSGHTDGLGSKLRYSSHNTSIVDWSEAEILVARDAGLVIDLRSAPERQEDDAQLWMKEASSGYENNNHEVLRFETTTKPNHRPIRVVELPINNASQPDEITEDTIFGNVQIFRYVIRLDVLSRFELTGYARNEWLHSPQATMNQVMTELNKRGLAGLNEAILETRSGKSGMCLALKLMTLYREAVANTRCPATDNHQTINEDETDETQQVPRSASIVFHCVQGKDRTGMLAMLMQLLMGCSDTIIVDDYYLSNAAFATAAAAAASASSEDAASAAAAMLTKQNTTTQKVRMDASVFRGTNRAAMVSTLEGLRLRHGPSFGYFDFIGFDSSWRRRFVKVFGLFPTSRL
mmetsp:Transcript_9115/g.22631  ORF Transcript_9115/g.22631 Transcript_9115/m.22631 type:complete len:407 (+) Transcript_9115:90-1310(+)